MATFEKQPVSQLPALYRHFVRHTNSPDTPPWPPEGKEAIVIQPQMRHPNQYVMVILFLLPAGTEVRLHGVWDPKATGAKYAIHNDSLRDLEVSYPQLLKELSPELASAKVAHEQAKLLKDELREKDQVRIQISSVI